MDEYAGFIEASLRGLSAGRVARQKAMEELILAPFSMAGHARKNSKKSVFINKLRRVKLRKNKI